MQNIAQLNRILSPANGLRQVLNELAPIVRQHLTHTPREAPITTTQLVEMIYPATLARQEGFIARNRMFQVVKYAASRDLADCAIKGTPRKLGNKRAGKTIVPWLWACPGQPNRESFNVALAEAQKHHRMQCRKWMRFSVRRLGYEETARIVQETLAMFDDPVMRELEAETAKEAVL